MKRKLFVWGKKVTAVFLILSILLFSFPPALSLAATSPWSETDWTGQSGSNITTSTPGQLTLSSTESLTNTGFETDLTGWSNTNSYSLNDEFTTNLPTTLVSGVATLTNAGVITPVVGGELWDAPASAFTTGTYAWTKFGTNTIANVANKLVVTYVDNANGAFDLLRDASDLSSNLTVGSWYNLLVDANTDVGSTVLLAVNNGSDSTYTSSLTSAPTSTRITFRAKSATSGYVTMSGMGAGETATLDNLSLKPLTTSSLFSTVDAGNANVVISTDVTLTPGTQAGIVMNMDAAQQNYVLAYHDGTNAHLVRVVGGVYQTENINTATTYVAGAKLKVIKNGTSYTLVYGTTQVGTTQTISDAGITGNTIHGLFSTLSTNSFANFLITTNLDGTSAEPTGGVRTVTDTNSKLSITGNQLSFATGGVGAGNPGLWYPSTARASGKVLMGTLNLTSGGNIEFGFDNNQAGAQAGSGIFLNGSFVMTPQDSGNTTPAITAALSTGVNYQTAIVLRSTGQYIFIKGGGFSTWTLLWASSINSTATLYPGIGPVSGTTSVLTADNIRIPTDTWLPTPLVSDGFSAATTDGSGHAEANGGSGLAWTGSTWTVSGGKVTNAPTEGSEAVTDGGLENWTSPTNLTSWTEGTAGTSTLNQETTSFHGGASAVRMDVDAAEDTVYFYQNGTFTLGQWYVMSFWAKNSNSKNLLFRNVDDVVKNKNLTTSYQQYFDVVRGIGATTFGPIFGRGSGSASTSVYVDDISVKALTLSSLFRTVDSGSADVVSDVAINLTSGTQGGIVARLDNATSPGSFVIAYIDGTNAKVDEYSGGAYTNRISAAATPVANGVLRLVLEGANARLYYNSVLIGTSAAIGVTTGTLTGLFSTYSGNNFDNFTVWSRSGYAVPSVDLTSTRVTATKYSGSASAQLVAGTNDANFTQSVNVGDTRTHNLTAYAYTDGSAVTTSDLDLYYGTSTIATTFTDMGGGWYKLTGTATGVASAQDVGVRVHSGKTVYVDDFSFMDYAASGTLTSSIFDTQWAATWGTLTYTATTPANTTATVKIRTSNDSAMSGATDFASCTAIASGADISSNGCVTDTHRYAQYQVTLTSTTGQSTPTFSDFSLTFSKNDATAPAAFDLDSPAADSYTQLERPTFRWHISSDAGGISKYVLSIDNGETGDFTIDNIPPTGTADYVTSRYVVHYDGDYIQVYTKSSVDWGAGANDGKLKEGKRNWKVTVYDFSDNTAYASRDLYVDFTSPTLTAAFDSQGEHEGYQLVNTQNPVATGLVTDNLNIEKVTVDYYKQMSFLGVILSEDLVDSETLLRGTLGTATSWTYTFTTSKDLDFGKYVVYLKAYDKAGNVSATVTEKISILTQEKINLLLGGEPGGAGKLSLPELEKKALIRREMEAAELTKLTTTITNFLHLQGSTLEAMATTIITWMGNFFTATGEYLAAIWETTTNYLVQAFQTTCDYLADLFQTAYSYLATLWGRTTQQLAGLQLPALSFPAISWPRVELPSLAINLPAVRLPQFSLSFSWPDFSELIALSQRWAQAFNQPLLAFQNFLDQGIQNLGVALVAGVRTSGEFLASFNQQALTAYETGRTQAITQARALWSGEKLTQAMNLILTEGKKPVVGAQGFLGRVRIAWDTAVAILFSKEPTAITDVTIEEVGRDYAVVSFKTNHPAWGKVNYGETLSYGQEVLLKERDYTHSARLTGLEPGKKYFFEVMAQNKNYAYDAYYVLEMPQ